MRNRLEKQSVAAPVVKVGGVGVGGKIKQKEEKKVVEEEKKDLESLIEEDATT